MRRRDRKTDPPKTRWVRMLREQLANSHARIERKGSAVTVTVFAGPYRRSERVQWFCSDARAERIALRLLEQCRTELRAEIENELHPHIIR